MSKSIPDAELRPRLAHHAWARRAAARELDGLEWVDARIDADGPLFRETCTEDGSATFAHLPYAAFLPPPMVRAAMQAQAQGRATLLEALHLLFARVEWRAATRHLVWSPLSPTPEVLAVLVEAFGVEPALHGDRPEALARIASLLPSWRPFRGSVTHARALLEAATGVGIEVRGGAERPQAAPTREPDLEEQTEDEPTEDVPFRVPPAEIFACRSSDWLAARGSDTPTTLRIDGGFLTIDGLAQNRAEDAFVALSDAPRAARPFARLLPPWCTIRVLALRDANV
jgi:hypothetical protein